MNTKFPIRIILLVASFAIGCSLLTDGTIVFEGTSMLPSIKSGDKLKTLRLDAQARAKLVRGDVVAFRYPRDPSKGYIKRIIALPGETVESEKGQVLVNGTKLSEPYVSPEFNLSQQSQPSMTVPQQSYYVLGDNRDNSSDSRIWGFVPEELVYAKIVNQ